MGKWLDGVIIDLINKNQNFGNLTDKQIQEFTKYMRFNKKQFYGRTYVVYTYQSKINDEIVTFKIQNNRFTIESESLVNEYENFKKSNEIEKCKSMIERLQRDLILSPNDEKKQRMLKRKVKELKQLEG